MASQIPRTRPCQYGSKSSHRMIPPGRTMRSADQRVCDAVLVLMPASTSTRSADSHKDPRRVEGISKELRNLVCCRRVAIGLAELPARKPRRRLCCVKRGWRQIERPDVAVRWKCLGEQPGRSAIERADLKNGLTAPGTDQDLQAQLLRGSETPGVAASRRREPNDDVLNLASEVGELGDGQRRDSRRGILLKRQSCCFAKKPARALGGKVDRLAESADGSEAFRCMAGHANTVLLPGPTAPIRLASWGPRAGGRPHGSPTDPWHRPQRTEKPAYVTLVATPRGSWPRSGVTTDLHIS